MELDAKIPEAPIEDMWNTHKEHMRLVGPRNRPHYKVIVVGTGLAGASAASSMAAMGYHVESFCFQDSPRRAHSIAAQGGINASKDYRNDGDSTYRLFYDTQKGGDYRSREANVWRLAELSTDIIDQAVAPSLANMAGCWPIDPSVAYWWSGPSTVVAKQGNNFSWVRALHSPIRFALAVSSCIPAKRWWMSSSSKGERVAS